MQVKLSSFLSEEHAKVPLIISSRYSLSTLVDDKMLKEFFKYAVVLIFVLSALLTPPDVLTQFLMAGPLILLYGVSIIIAKTFNPYEEPEEEEESD